MGRSKACVVGIPQQRLERERVCVYAPTEGFCREGRRREKSTAAERERERSGGKKSRRQIKERISSSNSLSLIPSSLHPTGLHSREGRPLLLLLLRCYTLAACTHGPQIESLPPQFRLRKKGGMLPDDKSWIEMRQ